MNIAQYLDSTYLKTPEQSGISHEETLQKDKELAQEEVRDYYLDLFVECAAVVYDGERASDE